ncbi:IS200/IS605 family transposase [soil metagenome]
MPFIKIYVHLVWSTKKREPYLYTQQLRKKVWQHIKQNVEQKGLFIDHVSGYHDHCHCLVSLGAEQTIANVAKLIKGESARWINNEGLTEKWFEWQDEYFAVSVAESGLSAVRQYIKNQESHHQQHSFIDECNAMAQHYGFKMDSYILSSKNEDTSSVPPSKNRDN